MQMLMTLEHGLSTTTTFIGSDMPKAETIIIDELINVKDFINNIKHISETKRIDYLDAVMLYCEETGLEIETAAAFIRSNPKIKAQIRSAAEDQNYFPKSAQLPI